MLLGLRAAIYPVGGFELGLLPDGTPGTAGGGGIKVAAVKDPFGNRLGLIENPHFKASEVR